MNDPSIKVSMDTLRQAEQCLNDAGHRMSASRLDSLARALYRRPHIWELVKREMTKILVEDTRGMWQEMVDDEDSTGQAAGVAGEGLCGILTYLWNTVIRS